MERANARMILGDQQGLGKTVQICALLKLHPELLPAVIEVKTTISEQWRHEIIRWCGTKGYLTQVIKSGKEFAAPGFNIYVITYDLAKNEKEEPQSLQNLKERNILFLVLINFRSILRHLKLKVEIY